MVIYYSWFRFLLKHVISTIKWFIIGQHCVCWWHGSEWHHSISCQKVATPVQVLEYAVQTRSISCLLMPCLLVSPGNQQSWYWLWTSGWFLSSILANLKNLHLLTVVKWHSSFLKIIRHLRVMSPLSSTTGVKMLSFFVRPLSSLTALFVSYRDWAARTPCWVLRRHLTALPRWTSWGNTCFTAQCYMTCKI